MIQIEALEASTKANNDIALILCFGRFRNKKGGMRTMRHATLKPKANRPAKREILSPPWDDVPLPNGPDDYGAPSRDDASGTVDRLKAKALSEIEPSKRDPWDEAVFPLDTLDLSTVPTDAVPERKWIVSDLIPDRNVTDISGDGGLGKSLLALQLGIAMTAKCEWIGTLPKPGVVLYVSCEDDRDEILRRRNAVLAGMGLRPKDLDGFYLLDLTSADATELAGYNAQRQFGPTELYARIEATIAAMRRKHPADDTRACAIIDTRADMFGGNELSRVEVRAFVRALRRLCLKHDMAVILLSHPSNSGMNSGSGQSGSTAWGNSVRSRLYLTAPKASEDSEPDPDLRILSNKKSNYGPRGSEIVLRWKDGMFRPEGGSLTGLDRKLQEKKIEMRFLELLKERGDQNRRVNSSSGPNYAPKLFAQASKDITRNQFRDAMERLFAAGEIIVEPFQNKSKPSTHIILTDVGMRRVGIPF
jgi:RecA-family ATPase